MKGKNFTGPEDFPKIGADDCAILFKEINISQENSLTLNEV